MYYSPLNFSDCFYVIFFSFYFLNALQKDINSNRVYVLGHNNYLSGDTTVFTPIGRCAGLFCFVKFDNKIFSENR